jgi:hypothetical protein
MIARVAESAIHIPIEGGRSDDTLDGVHHISLSSEDMYDNLSKIVR